MSLKRLFTAVHSTVLGLGGVKGEQETLLKEFVTTWDGNKEGWGAAVCPRALGNSA